MVEKSQTDAPRTGVGSPADAEVASARSEASSYEPRTPLGQSLWEIRSRIVGSGEPLLGWEEIEQEVAKHRGEVE